MFRALQMLSVTSRMLLIMNAFVSMAATHYFFCFSQSHLNRPLDHLHSFTLSIYTFVLICSFTLSGIMQFHSQNRMSIILWILLQQFLTLSYAADSPLLLLGSTNGANPTSSKTSQSIPTISGTTKRVANSTKSIQALSTLSSETDSTKPVQIRSSLSSATDSAKPANILANLSSATGTAKPAQVLSGLSSATVPAHL